MDGMSGTEDRYDGMDDPHPYTFAALYRGASHTYLHQWDEAMKHNRINALAMRRDCWLMSLLYERVNDTLAKRWHLEVDNPRDPWQKSVADGMTKILRCTPHLKRMMRYMLHGSLWYGRYGANFKWIWDDLTVPVMQRSGPIAPGVVSEPQFEKRRVLRIQKHKPVNGDKISFHHDDTPYVMLNAGWADHLRGRPEVIYPTGAGSAALLLRGTWREQIFIAESDPDDADFFEAEMAAGVHGVGIRSRIYWLDFMRRDYISWVVDSMERIGLGLVVIEYDASNADAKKEAFTVAKNYSRRAAICMPVSPDKSWQGGSINVVEAPTAGAQIVLELQKHIENQIERFIIGQNMSGGTESQRGSFGGSGGAEFASDTKRKLCMQDADDFAQSMTGSDVNPSPLSVIKKWVYPFADFPVWMVFDHEQDDPAKKMEAIKTCVDMGVSFPENRVRELTGIPAPEEGDEIIGGKQALALEQAANLATGGVIGGGAESGGLDSGAPDEGGGLPPEFEGGWQGSGESPLVHYADTHWVTLGGHAEGGEKHKGGFPVKLDGSGNIVSSGGPSELIGKNVSEVKGTFRQLTQKHQRLSGREQIQGIINQGDLDTARSMTEEYLKRGVISQMEANDLNAYIDSEEESAREEQESKPSIQNTIQEKLKEKGGIDLGKLRAQYPDMSNQEFEEAILEIWRQDRENITMEPVGDNRDFTREEHEGLPKDDTGKTFGYLLDRRHPDREKVFRGGELKAVAAASEKVSKKEAARREREQRDMEALKREAQQGNFSSDSPMVHYGPEHFIPVKPVSQENTWDCGAVCALVCGKLRGVGPDTQREWSKELGTTAESSTDPHRIVQYFTELGVDAQLKQGMTLDDLRKCWADGNPVIVMVREYDTGDVKTKRNYGHYLVVVGIDHGHVFVFDPSEDNILEGEDSANAPGLCPIREEDFLSRWHDRDYYHTGIIVGQRSMKYSMDLSPEKGIMPLVIILNRIRNQGVGREMLPELRDFLRRYPDLAKQLPASDLAFINTRS